MMTEENIYYYLAELEDNLAQEVIYDWIKDKGNDDKLQSWRVIPSHLLIAEYQYSLKHGFNRDKFIDKFQEIITENILKLQINTVLFGHTELNPFYVYEHLLDENMTEESFDELLDDFEWYACDEKGNWRISDYALKPLYSLLVELYQCKTSEQKFYIIDKILNVVHQRSDLTKWFVEDGIVLDMIATN